MNICIYITWLKKKKNATFARFLAKKDLTLSKQYQLIVCSTYKGPLAERCCW